MAKPWEKYAQAKGPWEKYQAPAPQQSSDKSNDFFNQDRYALENIPSTKEQMLAPSSEEMKNIAFGTMGASGGLSAAGAAPVVKTPLQALGKKVYQSAFKRADEIANLFGKKPVSEVLFERGITGTSKQISEKSKKLIDDLVQQQRDILAKVDQSVPEADLDRALQPLKSKIDELRATRDPVKNAAADALAEDLQTYQNIKGAPLAPGAAGPEIAISPSQMNAMKTTAQNVLPKSAYSQEIAKINPVYTQGKKALGAGLRQEVQRSAEQASPELAQQLLGVNTDLGSLLTTGKPLQQEVMKATNKNLLTSVDPMVAALGHTSGVGLPALAAKKAADISKTPWFRTNLGQDLMQFGEQSPQNALKIWYLLDQQDKANQGEE